MGGEPSGLTIPGSGQRPRPGKAWARLKRGQRRKAWGDEPFWRRAPAIDNSRQGSDAPHQPDPRARGRRQQAEIRLPLEAEGVDVRVA